ncbi:hypothetical protein M885DRAFT_517005 [Pelagophyceae sp. CCMP2097]|nr:hypothetical protein M885DRAFT_517005 [Pelagophyceae sp. CCMP2097]
MPFQTPQSVSLSDSVVADRRLRAARRIREHHGGAVRTRLRSTASGAPLLADLRRAVAAARAHETQSFVFDGRAATRLEVEETVLCGRCGAALPPPDLMCVRCSGLQQASQPSAFPRPAPANDADAKGPFVGALRPAHARGDTSDEADHREAQIRAEAAWQRAAFARRLAQSDRHLAPKLANTRFLSSSCATPRRDDDEGDASVGASVAPSQHSAASRHSPPRASAAAALAIRQGYAPANRCGAHFYASLEAQGVAALYGRFLKEGARRGDGTYSAAGRATVDGLEATFPRARAHRRHVDVFTKTHHAVEAQHAEAARPKTPGALAHLEASLRRSRSLGLTLLRGDEPRPWSGAPATGRRDLKAFTNGMQAKYEQINKEHQMRSLGGVKWRPDRLGKPIDDLLHSLEASLPALPGDADPETA